MFRRFFGGAIAVAGVVGVIACSQGNKSTSSGLTAPSPGSAAAITGNGAPSGPHYNLNLIGVPQDKSADMTGSGNETSAHLRENGRITLMFCAFEERPKILRIYGRGRTVLRNETDWANLAAAFEQSVGLRQIILVDVNRVATSCGFGVPMMKFVDERGLLEEWAKKKGSDGLEAYRREKNVRSIDGLITPLAGDDGAE